MSDEFQTIFSILILVISALGGNFLRTLSGNIKDLKITDEMLMSKFTLMERQMVGEYVSRQEFVHTMERLYDKIDKMHDDLGRVVQTSPCQHLNPKK